MTELSKERHGRITASSAGAILGVDPYRTSEDVMRQMVRDWHSAEPEFTGNVATQWGTANEANARGQYEMESGNKVTKAGFFIHPEHDWLGATPDGLTGDYGLLEIKCPFGLRNNTEPKFKSLFEQTHYLVQIIVQLACTKRTWCDFYQWAPYGSETYRYYIDFKFEEDVLPKLKKFYDRYLIERDNPEPYLEPKRREINTLTAQKLVNEYYQLDDAISLATERKKEVLASLVELAGESNSIVCGHNLTKVERSGSISYAQAIKKLCPDADLEPWRGKPTEYWVIK